MSKLKDHSSTKMRKTLPSKDYCRVTGRREVRGYNRYTMALTEADIIWYI